ncbi:hypothetical protein ONV78_17880 [Hahella sp. CR1]|uniref:CFI-box-CTERM domain-containing protein n=1 Tax=Hahella sp. CR1 TaxID=2992807 RepID=UPI002442CB15|nr:CFI-box-CTERM domain-containing protein [Hahella sp. CR1]MDG9669612.1 hypothetical protein [Hahella sp. CR1]
MPESKRSNEMVSASRVGRAAFCPHYLELEAKGSTPTTSAVARQMAGEAKHEEFSKKAEDKRCFVATHLYGIDDPRTEALRQYRDLKLSKTWYGRRLISIYYTLSPALVRISRPHPIVSKVLKLIVDRILNTIS